MAGLSNGLARIAKAADKATGAEFDEAGPPIAATGGNRTGGARLGAGPAVVGDTVLCLPRYAVGPSSGGTAASASCSTSRGCGRSAATARSAASSWAMLLFV
jgi:hypothetical protein